MTDALLVLLVYWGTQTLTYYLNCHYTGEPIVYGFLVGLVMGDVQTGLIMGAALEAIFLGVAAIGGTRPTDAQVGSVIATYFAIKTGCDLEAAIALAYPIGVISNSFYSMMYSIKYLAVPWTQNLILEKHDTKKYAVVMNIWLAFLSWLPKYLTVFLAIWLGTDILQTVIATVPAWVLGGLSASGKMLTAVGMGIILSLMWNIELGGFFFIGFLLAKAAGFSLIQMTVIGVALALIYFFIIKNINEGKQLAMNEKGDDFEL